MLLFDVTFHAREANIFFMLRGSLGLHFILISDGKLEIIHTWAVQAITGIAKVTCTDVRSNCIVTNWICMTSLVGEALVNIYDKWKKDRMDLAVFNHMHFTFFCDNTINIHLRLWYYKDYMVLNDRRLSNRTRWLYILMEIMISFGLSVSIHE